MSSSRSSPWRAAGWTRVRARLIAYAARPVPQHVRAVVVGRDGWSDGASRPLVVGSALASRPWHSSARRGLLARAGLAAGALAVGEARARRSGSRSRATGARCARSSRSIGAAST